MTVGESRRFERSGSAKRWGRGSIGGSPAAGISTLRGTGPYNDGLRGTWVTLPGFPHDSGRPLRASPSYPATRVLFPVDHEQPEPLLPADRRVRPTSPPSRPLAAHRQRGHLRGDRRPVPPDPRLPRRIRHLRADRVSPVRVLRILRLLLHSHHRLLHRPSRVLGHPDGPLRRSGALPLRGVWSESSDDGRPDALRPG